ncbi:MAG: undecaprenyl/decaprenyl-phosphate alpha-N-acetylglucosaminyl 1-phosphate transferase [Chloroflexi bacterium]|nr:undecaprenyl/decaprenyl-phosphate alpha-N-acetylglucosaminyl 1-phosphate transferase [Chloroflexota bacterium]
MSLETWYALVVMLAALAAIPAVVGMERVGWALGLVDRPRPGEVQHRPLARTGGYGVFIAFWAAIGASFLLAPSNLERLPADNWRLLGLLLGSLVIIPLALLDDFKRLGPAPQIVGHFVIATIPVLFGLRVEELATPFGILAIPAPLAGPLAALWIVGMINAINFIDTMDGLASGVGVIAAGVLFLRSAWFGQASIAVLPLALAGACAGFLTRNWPPARVILGSSGSLFLGYVLGATAVIGGAKIGTAFLVLAVPILDVAWVVYRRVAEHRSPFRGGDSAHLAHRLRLLGFADSTIALTLYAITAAVGAAILLSHTPLPTLGKLYLAAAVIAAVSALLIGVNRAASARLRKQQTEPSVPDPVD